MNARASRRFDAIVIGAGVNGLTTAALLAKKGRRVIVVDARDVIGGLAGGEEFHPGYRHAGVLHETAGVRRWAVEALGLENHGLVWAGAPDLLVPQTAGPGLVLSGPETGTGAGSIWKSLDLSPADREALAGYNRFLERVRPPLRRFLDQPPFDLVDTSAGDLLRLALTSLGLRRLGKRDMMEVLRILPMPVADWLGEWFDSDLLAAALAGPAVYSTYTGPRSPGSNSNLVLQAAAAGRAVAGGPRGLVFALEKAALSFGVEIRCGSKVERVILERGAAKETSAALSMRVAGIELAGGERIEASTVAASCDPKQLFLDLLPAAALAKGFEAEMINFRARGTTAKIHLALSGYPEFTSRPGRLFDHVRTGESLDELERAFDAVKYRRISDRPVLDIHFPSRSNPELAPKGHHVASILVSFVPFELDGGWTTEAKTALHDSVMSVLESVAPGIETLIVGSETLSPADLAERYLVTEGHLHHGEHALDQLLIRPAPQCSGYATPFEGLFLCGSGAHPGGGLTCAPGALAARAIAKAPSRGV